MAERIDLKKYYRIQFPHINLATVYDEFTEEVLTTRYSITDDEREWINDNLSGTIYNDDKYIYFEMAEDVMAFKLRWL